MRTTLTIDDDVAIRLDQLRKKTGDSFKNIVNMALRAGAQQVENPVPGKERPVYHTPSVSLGKCKLGNIVNVWDAIAAADGEDHR